MTEVKGLSALCVACGLCCDGSLFRFLPLEADDVARVEGHGLPVVTQSGRRAMPLPCSKLAARRCSVWPTRPHGCRAYVCHLGHRLEHGLVPFADALAVVREAQRRVEALRRAWPGDEPVIQRATALALTDAVPSEAALDALRAAREWLDEQLHWPEAP